MFDQVPVRAWLLIAIAAVAYMPVRYICQHIAHSPSRRDITQPTEDLSWRTSGELIRSAGIVVALLGLAIFIFTPIAEQFAHSPRFFPVLMMCFGAWAISTVPKGFMTGRVQPFIKGFHETYERGTQPKRFWASLAWNALFGCLFIWLAFQPNKDAPEDSAWDQCFDEKNMSSPQEVRSACNKLVGKYNEAIRLTPNESSSYFNRALAYREIGDNRRALADFNAFIHLAPNDADAYLNRGLMFLDTDRFDEAIADFARAHELRSKDPWPLANRGIAYAWKNDRARAEKDFQAVRAIDPSNPVVLRGEALLGMNEGDMETAVSRLTEALNHDPDDAWSLNMRAMAYRALGEDAKARADTDRLTQLTKGKD
jgi:Tfp pilus assembly protein PilF